MVHVDPSYTDLSNGKLRPWQLRRRIEAAATHIETNPELLDLFGTNIPHERTGTGGALAWIGHFYGVRGDGASTDHVLEHLGLPDEATFHARLKAIDPQWHHSAAKCARALEKYALVHHPDEVTSS